MRLSDLDYPHPVEAIAQRPLPRRDDARLLVVPEKGSLRDTHVRDLPAEIRPGDVFVLNESRVRPARLFGRKESGGRVELLVLGRRPPATWLAMIRASHAPAPGAILVLPGATLRVSGREAEVFLLERVEGCLDQALAEHGVPPLPPYIRRPADESDRERYQTTHARSDPGEWDSPGSSVAAPTAGLHFTPDLRARLEAAGAILVHVALGVGPGTFRPIETDRVEDHRMHDEPVEISGEAAEAVNAARAEGRCVTAVGTTSLRALEAAASSGGIVRSTRGRTGLFLLPGARLRTADRLLTNFHQPRSTLLALVAAFAGTTRALEAHREAIARGYRLFSYGDAMLVDRQS